MALPRSYTIDTPRCLLRVPGEDDLKPVFDATRTAGFNDGLLWDPSAHINDLRGVMLRQHEYWDRGESYTFSIVLRETGEFVGRIAIRMSDAPGQWIVGYFTLPKHQGKGYMREALAAVIRLGFETLGIETIIANSATWNDRSIRLLEAAGMKHVGVNPRGFMKRGKWVAENRLAIDRATWLAARH